MKKMQHIEEIKDYWNLRANGFSLAVEEELRTESGKEWEEIFRKTITKKKPPCWMTVREQAFSR